MCRASRGAVERCLLLRGHHATEQRGNRSNKTHPQHHTHQERDEHGRRTRATLVSMRSVPFKLLRTSHMHAMVSSPMFDLYDDMRAKSSREDRGRLQLGTRFPLGAMFLFVKTPDLRSSRHTGSVHCPGPRRLMSR